LVADAVVAANARHGWGEISAGHRDVESPAWDGIAVTISGGLGSIPGL
jgi:hypothetical protein